MKIPVKASYRKAAQGAGGGYIPHIQCHLYGRRKDGSVGWFRKKFNSPRIRLWSTREPWNNARRFRRLQQRVARWAWLHGYEVTEQETEFGDEYKVHKWYIDIL